jgi:hypothetical protein
MMRHGLIGVLLFLVVMGAAAQQPEYTHQVVEVDRAFNFSPMGWSPTDLVLAYFRHAEVNWDEIAFPQHGELHFYSLVTGENCAYPNAIMDDVYENGTRFDKNLWLADGEYLSIQEEKAVIFTPCEDGEREITAHLPASAQQTSIVSYSPQRDVILLRTNGGIYLYDLARDQSVQITGAINDFDFFQGRGTVSPDGERFAFTLNGPGDTYVIDIDGAQANTAVDEPLPPGEDECCTTPDDPRWLGERFLVVSTQSMGLNGRWGNVVADLSEGIVITSPDEAYRIEDAYVSAASETLVLILSTERGEYALTSAPKYEIRPYEGEYAPRIIKPSVMVQDGGSDVFGRSLLTPFPGSFSLLQAEFGNYAANTRWIAGANDQFVTIYELDGGEWIETLAPPGYHRFEIRLYRQDISMWSSDGHSLAIEALQRQDRVLLVATIEELALE